MSDINILDPITRQNFSENVMPQVSSSINQAAEMAQEALKNIKATAVNVFGQIQAKVLNTSFSPVIKKANAICHDAEKIFNIAGSTPWIGFLSGNVRCLFGYAQAIAGIALTTLSELGLIIASFSKDSDKMISQWKILSKAGTELTIHGCLNFIRGSGEVLVGSFTFGLGNIVLLLPNIIYERNFAPYFAYGTLTNECLEQKNEGVI